VAPPETPRRKRRASRGARRAGCDARFSAGAVSTAAAATEAAGDADVGGGGAARVTAALSTEGRSVTAVDSRGRPVPTPTARCSERDSASRRCHTSVPMTPIATTLPRTPRTILRRPRCGVVGGGRRVGGVGRGVAGADGGGG